MAKFKDLTTLAGYTIRSAETINLFLKGLTLAPDVFDKVMDYPTPNNYHELRDKAISVVKARQLVNALKKTTALMGRFVPQPFRPQNRPPAPSGPPPHFPQYNSTNAPRWMNNTPVPMDLSRGRALFNRRGGQLSGQGQWRGARGNVAQTDQQIPQTKGPCFKCGKPGHSTRECRSRTQINNAHYLDDQDDMVGIQPPLQPSNLLSNTLAMFDSLPNDQKDKLIQKYEGENQDFPDV